jgi:hypothetical protein
VKIEMLAICLLITAGVASAQQGNHAKYIGPGDRVYPAGQPSTAASVSSKPSILTNSEVVFLVKSGLPADVVAAKVKVSACDFDTSTDTLNALHAQGIPSQVLAAMIEAPHADKMSDDGRTRIFVTDSQSWEVRGGSFGQGSGSAAWNDFGGSARSSFNSGSYSSGGARPQTMEITKTLGERCPDLIVTNKPENANYVVTLDHEGGKNPLSHHKKIAVFNRQGDAIFSRSTIMLGDSVKDACQVIHSDASVRQIAQP